MGNSTLAIFRMSVWFRYAVAIAGFALAIGATAPSWAQAIAPAPVNPQAAPAVESVPSEPSVTVEPATGVGITWSVVNRFRLFRGERDFRRHAEAAQGRTVLDAEQALASASDGAGWARDLVGRLCLDRIGPIVDQCLPDDVAEDFRPGRVGFSGDKACDGDVATASHLPEWARLSARWMNAACHRSLYGYQLRAALALAIESPHLAVTFLPLGCTGATIADGLFNSQRSRELDCAADGTPCPATTPAQMTQLRAIMTRAQRSQPARTLDLVFLTVGANDINFSGLIADIIIEARGERALFSRAGIISTIDAAQATLDKKLPGDFARLRAALKPLATNPLERAVC